MTLTFDLDNCFCFSYKAIAYNLENTGCILMQYVVM